MSLDTSTTMNSSKFDTFTCFPRLPAELRLKIIGFAARTVRYIPISLRWQNPSNDEYERKIHDSIRYSTDTAPNATYTPDKNYAAILQVNKEFRTEILEKLKHFEYVENHATSLSHPLDLYINWGSDILILDYAGMWSGWQFRRFTRFTRVIPDREKNKIQRIVVPMPKRYTEIPYMEDIRRALPNLRELFFLNGGHFRLDLDNHPCEFLPNLVGHPRVLVDISDGSEDCNQGDSLRKFGELRDEFKSDKVKCSDWKLEKVRLVVWASDVEV